MGISPCLSIILTILLVQINCFAQDEINLKIFNSIKQKDWEKSYTLASSVNDPALIKIVLSRQFLDNSYEGNNFRDISNFLLKNPDWPQNNLIQIAAENLLNKDVKPSIIVNFFKIRKPLTAVGFKYHALSLFSLDPKSAELPKIIKAGWHKGKFTLEEQKNYYSKFKNYLNVEDHIKKIDNHLAKSEVTAARESFYLVSKEFRKSFELQIALIQNPEKAKLKFKHISQKYYTSGLIYRYLDARKNDLLSSAEIARLVNFIKSDDQYADKIWHVQHWIAREFIQNKKFSDAYRVLKYNLAYEVADKSNAEFLSGWLALRFLNKPKLAIVHFENFNKIVKTAISKSRGLYWLARAYEAANEREKADKLYKIAAEKYPFCFYGQVAASELGVEKLVLKDSIKLKNQDAIDPKIADNHLFRATELVLKYGNNALSDGYIEAAIARVKSHDTEGMGDLASVIIPASNIRSQTWFAKQALQKHGLIKKYAYPTPYELNNLPLERALIYSVIRQESVFNDKAVSSANAKGLMQLLDSTACATAGKIGEICSASKLITDKSYNIKLGSNYLSELINLYEGSYILAILAYNGGAHNVNKWLKIYGDPRKMKDMRQVLDWLESVPFYETRNYVQRVLENLQIYRNILSSGGKLMLQKDLTRNSLKVVEK